MSDHDLAAVPEDAERAVDETVAVLEGGGVVLLPTDTVYGLAALPTTAGLDRIFELKDRPAERAVAVLVASRLQAEQVAVVGAADAALMAEFWPGPLTLVLPRRNPDAPIGAADGTIGVRSPARALVRAVAERVGPLAVTSANRSGEPTEIDALGAARSLVGAVDLIVDGGPCDGVASTVARIEGTLDHPVVTVFREGPLSASSLEQTLHP